MNGTEFADLCGVSQGALSGLENGKSYPSAETIISLLKKTDIDLKWLLTGEMDKQISEIKFLEEIRCWLISEIQQDERVESWFQFQFEELFPRFKSWKETRSINLNDDAGFRKQANGGGWK